MTIKYHGETFQGYNKPKRTPRHKTKSHVVLAKVGSKVKMIRFGQQGVRGEGKPKRSDTAANRKRRAAFKARHARNIKRGKMSAAWWSNRVKWILLLPLLSAGMVESVIHSGLTNLF